MPKKKIDISQCNAEDLRFKPFNLLWGGPLLVEDHRLQKRCLAKQAEKTQDAAEAQPEAQPEAQQEAPPPEEPTPPAEAAETPAVAATEAEPAAAEPAAIEPKKEDKAEEAKEDKMEKKKTKKKRHSKKKSRHVDDYDTDTDSSGSSLFLHEHRNTHGHHRNKCCCKHDEKTDEHKAAEKKKGAHSLRCPVCRQHVSISSSDNDTSADEKKIKRSHGSKREKKKKTTGKEDKKKGDKGRGDGNGDGANKEGYKTGEKEASPAVAEEDKTKAAAATDSQAEKPADANDASAAVEPDSNVGPTAQDVVPPLPSSVSGAGFSGALFDYPSQMTMPGFHPGFHDTLAYRPGPSYPPYPYPYPVPYPTYGFQYPSYPTYPYASPPPPVMPPPVPFLPPHMNMMPPPPPPMVPYPPPGDAYTDVDTYEHKSAAKTASEGGLADSGAAWHDDMVGGAGAGDRAKGGANMGNDEEDEWGIHWKPPVQNDGGNDTNTWGIDPCGFPESGGHNHADNMAPPNDQTGTAWTSDDLAVLGRLHEERITGQWRDLQMAFYNATGRVVDPEVLKSKIEQGGDKQEFEQQEFGNQGGDAW